MRVRVRASGIIRLFIVCGLIAEVALTPGAMTVPSRAVAAQGPTIPWSPATTDTATAATTDTATAATTDTATAATTDTATLSATVTSTVTPTTVAPLSGAATATSEAALSETAAAPGTTGPSPTATGLPTTPFTASATDTPLASPSVTGTVSGAATPAALPTPTDAATPPTGTLATLGSGAAVTSTLDGYNRLPLAFEPNQGQTDASVQFLSHGPGFSLYLTGVGATLAVARSRVAGRQRLGHGRGSPGLTRDDALAGITGTTPISATAICLRYEGGNPNVQATADDQLPGVANYLIGGDPSRWHTAIPTYATVSYHDVYPGVDLVYYGTAGRLEYDWRLAAGADPGRITLAVDGARAVRLDADGALALGTALGDIVQLAPRAY